MITIEKLKDYTLIRPDFDLVSDNLNEIKNTIFDLAGKGSYQIILELPAGRIIDPMGIGVILACLKTLKVYGGNLMIRTDDSNIISLFHILKLDHILAPL